MMTKLVACIFGVAAMLGRRALLIFVFVVASSRLLLAVEGPTAAGPIGGTDIRSALLPPPGVYGGAIVLGAGTLNFVDGSGKTIPALKDARLTKEVGGPFVYYVPDVNVLGGSIAFGAIVPAGNICGHLFTGQPDRCTASVGDPYVEVDWGRFFGKLRPSRFAGAYPIPEGLAVLLGFGVVVPAGKFDASDPLEQALSMGTKIWDFAPSLALTYTSPAILVDGTEVSVKLFWNNYRENPETQYRTGDLLNLDFAVTEHIGRFQAGVAGFYAVQTEGDRIDGALIPPDGRRGQVMQIGGVLAYDIPEQAASAKIKALTSVFAENTVMSWGVACSWVKKF
jgi:hypothetical protein